MEGIEAGWKSGSRRATRASVVTKRCGFR